MNWLPINNGMADLRQTADIIEEVDENTSYLGFCKPGTVDGREGWSIMKIEQSGSEYPKITKFLWAAGKCSFNLSWNERATYDYYYNKFRV